MAVTIAVTAAVVSFVIAGGMSGFLGEYTGTAIAFALILAGASEILRPPGGALPPWRDVGFSALEGLAASLLILPLFTLVVYLAAAQGMRLWRLDKSPDIEFIGGLLTMAAAEEVFFRGWLLARLDRHRPPRRRLLGAPVGLNILIATAVFSVAHVGIQGWPGLLVFFPGLIFGWLYERRHSLAGPIVFHFLCNVLVLVALNDPFKALYFWR
jgi:membrane protease YdiL (CAAX protease family)